MRARDRWTWSCICVENEKVLVLRMSMCWCVENVNVFVLQTSGHWCWTGERISVEMTMNWCWQRECIESGWRGPLADSSAFWKDPHRDLLIQAHFGDHCWTLTTNSFWNFMGPPTWTRKGPKMKMFESVFWKRAYRCTENVSIGVLKDCLSVFWKSVYRC